MPFLSTREQTLIVNEYIRIWEWLNDFCTPHVIRSTIVSRICKLDLSWPSYGFCKVTVSFLWNVLFVVSFYNAFYWSLICTIMSGFHKLGHKWCLALLVWIFLKLLLVTVLKMIVHHLILTWKSFKAVDV